MAREIRSFEVKVPAGTAQNAGWHQALTMPVRNVDLVEVRVPPGPNGNVGFALGSAGQPILPYNPGEWVVTNDEVVSWPLEGQFDSGAWEIFAYNTGQYDHTLYVRFLLSLVDPPAPQAVAPTLNLSVLQS